VEIYVKKLFYFHIFCFFFFWFSDALILPVSQPQTQQGHT